MFSWLTTTTAGKLLSTFLISMVPVVELRFGLPYGIALGLPYPQALTAAVLGNLLPVPFIIVYVRRVFAWLRRRNARFDDWVRSLERRANLKGEVVKKYGPIGLCLLVAIPLPGTGAWTGALVAALLDLGFVRSMLYIILGVLIAAGIMTLLTYGALAVF